ncbi:MAG TPA: nucleoside 2-deoxyribosyltransferase [Candidatus Dormibacteraeota bacterium]|nr:nucleoside 2-deoxyribosyltransferase [Candidatus Dormibacteraeota bacterium]
MINTIDSIIISSSSKFFPSAKAAADKLKAERIEVYTPGFVHNETLVKVDPSTKAQLTRSFLQKLKKADAVYVIAEGGYIGCSVAIEIGYASALEKPIILSEEAKEDGVKALVAAVLPFEKLSVQAIQGILTGKKA